MTEPGKAALFRRVAIIGAGDTGPMPGSVLAYLCVRAGYSTTLEDVLPGNLRRAAQQIASLGSSASDGLEYASSIEDAVRAADLVIDTVPDELESKLEILSLLDRMAPPQTLFCTPTDHLSIADLASCTYRPAQCFGLRFTLADPLTLTRVDVSHAPGCAHHTVAAVRAFFESLAGVVHLSADLRALP